MCKCTVTIGKIDQWRYLTCCEHGNIHLNWRKASFKLKYHEFLHLFNGLQHQLNKLSADIPEDRQFVIHIDVARLMLNLDDLKLLIGVMRAALNRLGEFKNPAEYAIRTYHKQLNYKPTSLFSLN